MSFIVPHNANHSISRVHPDSHPILLLLSSAWRIHCPALHFLIQFPRSSAGCEAWFASRNSPNWLLRPRRLFGGSSIYPLLWHKLVIKRIVIRMDWIFLSRLHLSRQRQHQQQRQLQLNFISLETLLFDAPHSLCFLNNVLLPASIHHLAFHCKSQQHNAMVLATRTCSPPPPYVSPPNQICVSS